MRKNLPVGDFTVDGLVIRVHQHRGLGHHIAAGSARIHFLDGVAGRAGDSVRVKVAIDGRTLRQRS